METDLSTYPVELASTLSGRLRTAKQELVTQWLDRITARVAISSKRVFPTHELINHVPLLIEGIAGYIKRPERDMAAQAPVVAKAMELGALRHAQGFDAYELLKEYEMLGEIIFDFLADTAENIQEDIPRTDFLACWQRTAQAIELIRQATVSHYLRLYSAQINERENRLRKFNRTVAHELKNKVNAISNASEILAESWADESERKEFEEIIARNADGLRRVLANLESLSRTQADSRHCRNVLLPVADSAKGERWVAIEATVEGPDTEKDREVVIRVHDNGIGIPADKREQLFQEFYRAHGETVTDANSSGLGLSIVRETVESIGGRAWAEFPEETGSTFAFAIPARRWDDLETTESTLGESPTAD